MKIKISQFYAINQVDQPSDLFNTFTDTFYFAKDRAGRFVYANQLLYEHFDLNDPADVIGRTDYDFFRRDIADQMHNDDLQVMQEKITISNKLELIQDGTGEVHWFMTTKMPLSNRYGEIVGVEGLSRDSRRSKVSIEPYNAFKNCISYLQKNYMHSVPINHLAELCYMSLSTFERKFKKQFLVTPKQYIRRLRIQESCALLLAGYGIQRAAMECGFCDQSYFTREFRMVMGITPRDYQLQYPAAVPSNLTRHMTASA